MLAPSGPAATVWTGDGQPTLCTGRCARFSPCRPSLQHLKQALVGCGGVASGGWPTLCGPADRGSAPTPHRAVHDCREGDTPCQPAQQPVWEAPQGSPAVQRNVGGGTGAGAAERRSPGLLQLMSMGLLRWRLQPSVAGSVDWLNECTDKAGGRWEGGEHAAVGGAGQAGSSAVACPAQGSLPRICCRRLERILTCSASACPLNLLSALPQRRPLGT